MKGMVFTELMDMVIDKFGEDLWDDVIDSCNLPSGGVYTASATYDHNELLQIVAQMSAHTGVPVRDLVMTYGRYLFGRFYILMPEFFEKPKTAYAFLESVDDYIHVEVQKLYPDAQLPKFTTQREGSSNFTMIYESVCPFADFAKGLIQGCIAHYGEDIDLSYVDHNGKGKYQRIFTMVKRDG